jgi:hypothetical protein
MVRMPLSRRCFLASLAAPLLAYPDLTRRPGEWMARYTARQLKATGRAAIDHLLLTHFDSDHIGEFKSYQPKSNRCDWRLTGITDIVASLPIDHLIDRGFPNYNYPVPLTDPTTANYRTCATAAAKSGTRVEALTPGSNTQLALASHHGYIDSTGPDVVRVAPGGVSWQVFITSNSDESDRITAKFGPFTA